MTPEPKLHHVVFAVAPERQAAKAQMFTDLGFTFENTELTELGVHVHLDWNRGIITQPFAMVNTLLVSLEAESVRRSTVDAKFGPSATSPLTDLAVRFRSTPSLVPASPRGTHHAENSRRTRCGARD